MAESTRLPMSPSTRIRSDEELDRFKEKVQEKLEDQAMDHIIATAKEYGLKAIPMLVELMKSR